MREFSWRSRRGNGAHGAVFGNGNGIVLQGCSGELGSFRNSAWAGMCEFSGRSQRGMAPTAMRRLLRFVLFIVSVTSGRPGVNANERIVSRRRSSVLVSSFRIAGEFDLRGSIVLGN